MTTVRVQLRRLDRYPSGWPPPEYATEGSAAVDIRNAGPTFALEPMERHLVPTGLALAVPRGMEAQIRPRSGLSYRRGVTIINAPCTIDSDYRGELFIPLVNLSAESQPVEHGDRVAQLLVARVPRIEWEPVDALPSSERGDGGFGSTGR